MTRHLLATISIALGLVASAIGLASVMPGASSVASTASPVEVLGRRITVTFLDGEVNSVSVKGQAEGFYAEALPDSAKSRASADSALRKTVPRKPQERP